MTIAIQNEQDLIPINFIKVENILNFILKEIKKENWDLSILIVDDAQIKEINKNYRGFEKATNVLSFSMLEDESDNFLKIYLENKVLGDIVISAETIMREAKEFNYTINEMLFFYLIHGLLHLVGYNHELGDLENKTQEDETERLFQLILKDI